MSSSAVADVANDQCGTPFFKGASVKVNEDLVVLLQIEKFQNAYSRKKTLTRIIARENSCSGNISHGAEGTCAKAVRELSKLHSKINDHIIIHPMVQQEDRGQCSAHMSYMSNSHANLE